LPDLINISHLSKQSKQSEMCKFSSGCTSLDFVYYKNRKAKLYKQYSRSLVAENPPLSGRSAQLVILQTKKHQMALKGVN